MAKEPLTAKDVWNLWERRGILATNIADDCFELLELAALMRRATEAEKVLDEVAVTLKAMVNKNRG